MMLDTRVRLDDVYDQAGRGKERAQPRLYAWRVAPLLKAA
jgi:hypothetical protein